MLLETGKAVRPASGRRARNVAACQEMHISLGQVRKAVDRQHWSARFQLRHEGKRLSFDAPMRVSKTDAETDVDAIDHDVAMNVVISGAGSSPSTQQFVDQAPQTWNDDLVALHQDWWFLYTGSVYAGDVDLNKLGPPPGLEPPCLEGIDVFDE